MKVKEIISELEKLNPELEVLVCELGKFEDNIPLIPVHSVENYFTDDEESENGEVVLINFKTSEKSNQKIVWEQGDLIERHDSGCAYYHLTGSDELGNEFEATGIYQSGELEDVVNVELIVK